MTKKRSGRRGKKSAFPFYPADWLLDDHRQDLSWSAQGVYIAMLALQWTRGNALPEDPDSIRRLLGADREDWKPAWLELVALFPLDGDDGYRRNPRLSRVWAIAQSISRERSRAGKRGNEARWGDRKRDRNGVARARASWF